MPLQIKIENAASQEQQVTLSGNTFYFKVYYNNTLTTDPWVLDILDINRNVLLAGKTICPSVNLCSNLHPLIDALGGWIFCINTIKTRTPMDRDNFGTDKTYQLIYYTKEELEGVT